MCIYFANEHLNKWVPCITLHPTQLGNATTGHYLITVAIQLSSGGCVQPELQTQQKKKNFSAGN